MPSTPDLFAPPPAWSEPGRWAGLLVAPEAEADLWCYRRRHESGTFVRLFRGRRCGTMKACIEEFGAVLQLPYCLAPTWRSLHENLVDADWPAAPQGYLMFTSAQRVLQRDAEGFSQLMGILGELATTNLAHRPAGAILRTAFQCETRFKGEVERRLDSLNVPWGPVG